MTEGGIYIHVPFCRNKCLYCDFYSGGSRIADWDLFTDSIINELESRRNELSFIPTTMYFGGGTPSLMPVAYLEKLINNLNVFIPSHNLKEFTMEVNPEDVDIESCKAWKDVGINRISIGVQSLNDNELKKIGRRHSAQAALTAVETLKKYFDNVSVDLMFGIPSQTVFTFKETLKNILSLRPEHVSAYSLMLEPGTALTLLTEMKKISLPQEDDWIKMFQILNENLVREGYFRYEISNYSLPGLESCHNSNYWLGNPYIGLGPGAHSYNGDNVRRSNPNDIKGYLNKFKEKQKDKEAFYQSEYLTEREKKEEMIMTRLRMSKGLDLEIFRQKFGESQTQEILHQSLPFIKQGLMKEENGFLKFTDKGFITSDSILCDLI